MSYCLFKNLVNFLFDLSGLYGRNGILPVETLMQSIKKESKVKNAESLFMQTPSLLWFLSVEADIGLEMLSIIGIDVED